MGALVYILPAIWGIITSIGLFCLKNWARISIIVFSVILILMGALVGVIMLLVPLPAAPNEAASQSTITGIRLFMAAFWFGIAGIGIWWVILFNRPKVKAQFLIIPSAAAIAGASQMVPQTPGVGPTSADARPLSITIIAWFLLAGCLFIPFSLLLHSPAILFTKIISGPAALVYFLVILGMHLYLGTGLLRLSPTARVVAIGYYILLFLNSAIFYFAPGAGARTQLLISSAHAAMPWMQQTQQPVPQFNLAPIMIFAGAVGLFLMLIPLYFLITRRRAFVAAKEAPAI
jgi:hypothetical protein